MKSAEDIQNVVSEPGVKQNGASKVKNAPLMNIEAIRQILPHRYPFLLVDRIIELEAGKTALGIKNVTANEQFFQGHFPTEPIMPGVLLIEAMAQVGGVMMLSVPEHRGKLAMLGGIDKARFRKPVVPGDTLYLHATVVKVRGNMGWVDVRAEVDGQVVAQAEVLFALQPR
jgi:3-hydroxyacyl-[acyl-carrier-protein] dehydratase